MTRTCAVELIVNKAPDRYALPLDGMNILRGTFQERFHRLKVLFPLVIIQHARATQKYISVLASPSPPASSPPAP